MNQAVKSISNPPVAKDSRIVILGAGPAGLTAAYELSKAGHRPIVLEMGDRVGGISRTEEYKGYRFDIGGHRFYTKVDEVQQLWLEVLGDQFRRVPRLSRIFYNGHFFQYPLQFMDTFTKLGPIESALMFLSYLQARLMPSKEEETFEQWVINRFGKRLFDTFFRTYTEKVWGIPCNEIRAEWAAQRIKDLSFRTAVMNAVFKPRKTTIKTLIEEFDYPALGPGMMWEHFEKAIVRRGGEVRLNTTVVSLQRTDDKITSVRVRDSQGEHDIQADHVISSLALKPMMSAVQPALPEKALHAARSLNYRDFVVVCLIVNQENLFPDNWIYIHTPEVKVGRIQNFRNWSLDLLADPKKNSLGMEYFCSVGDSMWALTDEEFIQMAKREIGKIGLADPTKIEDAFVIRQLKAYPVYDGEYYGHLGVIRESLAKITNLQTVGRNGLHRYNNQDHSMLTGLLAARNLLGERHDVWDVNTERSYYETFEVDRKSRGNIGAGQLVAVSAELKV